MNLALNKTHLIAFAACILLGVGFAIILTITSSREADLKTKYDSEVKLLDERLRQKDDSVRAVHREREALRADVGTLQEENAKLRSQIEATRQRLQTNQRKYEDVPTTVRNLSRDDVRRAALEYDPD